MSKVYKCPSCHQEHTAEEWHGQTAQSLNCDIDDLGFLGSEWQDGSCYFCPSCEIEIENGNEIILVKSN